MLQQHQCNGKMIPKMLGAIATTLLLMTLFPPFSTGFELGFSGPERNSTPQPPYNSQFRPNHDATTDMISVSLEILGIQDINEEKMEFTIDSRLRKSWTDPRLLGRVEKSTIYSNNNFPNVWLPDLYIENAISTQHSDSNSKSLLLRPEGEISLSERFVSRVFCPMSFLKFPFDKQYCQVKIRSYSSPNIYLDMVWNGKISHEHVNVFSSGFKLISTEQSIAKERTNPSEFTVLIATLVLQRNGLIYFLRGMVPGIVLTLFTYATLFIGRPWRKVKSTSSASTSSSNGKVGETVMTIDTGTTDPTLSKVKLGILRLAVSGTIFVVTILLTQINLITVPSTPSVTGLDIWFSVLGLVIGLVFLFNILFFIRFYQMEQANSTRITSTTIESNREEAARMIWKINRILIIGIPIFLLIFVITYFSIYLI